MGQVRGQHGADSGTEQLVLEHKGADVSTSIINRLDTAQIHTIYSLLISHLGAQRLPFGGHDYSVEVVGSLGQHAAEGRGLVLVEARSAVVRPASHLTVTHLFGQTFRQKLEKLDKKWTKLDKKWTKVAMSSPVVSALSPHSGHPIPVQ